MKKIKNLLKITLLTFAVSVNFSAFASAAEVSFEKGSNILSVCVPTENESILIVLSQKGKTADEIEERFENNLSLDGYLYYYSQVKAENGTAKAEINFDESAEKGIYELLADGTVYKVGYIRAEERAELNSDLKKSLENKEDFNLFFDENVPFLSIDYNLYDKCSDKSKIKEMIFAAAKPGDADEKIISEINNAVIVQALNEGLDISYEELAAKITLSDEGITDIINTAEKERKQEILNACRNKNYKSFADFEKHLGAEAALQSYNYPKNTDASAISENLIKNNKYLKLNLEAFEALSAQYRAEIVKKTGIAESTAVLQRRLDLLVSEYEGLKSSERGGGSGGGSSGKVTSGIGNAGTFYVSGASEGGFPDMSGYAWAEKAVNDLTGRSLILGYPDGSFRPEKAVTRAEFAAVLAKYMLDYNSAESEFTDVPKGHWAYRFISAMNKEALMIGSGNEFKPDSNITREEIAAVLARAAVKKNIAAEKSGVGFNDEEDISDYAKEAVYILKGAGVINGDEKGNFNPKAFAKRAEAAKMLYEFINLENNGIKGV